MLPADTAGRVSDPPCWSKTRASAWVIRLTYFN